MQQSMEVANLAKDWVPRLTSNLQSSTASTLPRFSNLGYWNEATLAMGERMNGAQTVTLSSRTRGSNSSLTSWIDSTAESPGCSKMGVEF